MRVGSVVLALALGACGGHAEKYTGVGPSSGGTMNGGGSAGSSGAGGSVASGGSGGAPSGSGGSATGGSAIGGSANGGSAAGGSGASGGTAGAPPKVLMCDPAGTLIQHDSATDYAAHGFMGTLDGSPLELLPVDPRAADPRPPPGSVSASTVHCKNSLSFDIFFNFDTPTRATLGFSVYASPNECSITTSYWPNFEDPDSQPAEGVIGLEVWVPDLGSGDSIFIDGEIDATFGSESDAQQIAGSFTVEAPRVTCVH